MNPYATPQDYCRDMRRPDGTLIERVWHCGKCMSVKVDGRCRHCSRKSQTKPTERKEIDDASDLI